MQSNLNLILVLANSRLPRGIMWIGKKPIGNYLAKIMEWFRTESKVKVIYLDSTMPMANHIFTLMEYGGFVVSKQEQKDESYTKRILKVEADKTIDGKPMVIEYFHWNESVRMVGSTIKEEFKGLIGEVATKGEEVFCNRTIKWRYIYKK